jgi:hypothetical protein
MATNSFRTLATKFRLASASPPERSSKPNWAPSGRTSSPCSGACANNLRLYAGENGKDVYVDRYLTRRSAGMGKIMPCRTVSNRQSKQRTRCDSWQVTQESRQCARGGVWQCRGSDLVHGEYSSRGHPSGRHRSRTVWDRIPWQHTRLSWLPSASRSLARSDHKTATRVLDCIEL